MTECVSPHRTSATSSEHMEPEIPLKVGQLIREMHTSRSEPFPNFTPRHFLSLGLRIGEQWEKGGELHMRCDKSYLPEKQTEQSWNFQSWLQKYHCREIKARSSLLSPAAASAPWWAQWEKPSDGWFLHPPGSQQTVQTTGSEPGRSAGTWDLSVLCFGRSCLLLACLTDGLIIYFIPSLMDVWMTVSL